MDVVLAPDVYVNASVALGSPPDKVVQRVLGENKGKSKATEWILDRVTAMLTATGSFKPDAVGQQIQLIRNLVQVVGKKDEHQPDDWEGALVAAAKSAGAKRVITDHPDLLAKETVQNVEFISTEAWLLERKMPPPPPPPRPR